MQPRRTKTDRRDALIRRGGADPLRFDKRPLNEVLNDEIPYARWEIERMARERAVLEAKASSYFASDKEGISFVSSGCTLLNCALGGGYPLSRIVNIVGDRSTAKSGLATEALINFVRAYPNGSAAYCESEAAFDEKYAEAMGLPLDKIDFRGSDTPIVTVEQFVKDFDDFLNARIKDEQPGIYVLDSLDALSDDAEMEREVGKATFGMAKPKLLSEFFRKTARKIEATKVLLIIVSQVRDNIGVVFGDKHKRSGGKALDFYATQILYLSHIKSLKRTVDKIERATGIHIRAKVKKNKIGLPFREADFDFLFAFGIDDIGASIDWLNSIGSIDLIGIKPSEVKEYLKEINNMNDDDFDNECIKVTKAVTMKWSQTETTFLPKRRKYRND